MGKVCSCFWCHGGAFFVWCRSQCNKIYVRFVYNWISKQVSTNQSSTKTSHDFRWPITVVAASQFCWHYFKNWEFQIDNQKEMLAYQIKRDLQSLTTCFSSKWASPFESYWKKPPFGCQWSNYSSSLRIGASSESRKPEEWVVLKKKEEKKLLENRAVDHEPIFRMDCLKKLLQFFSLTPKR